MRALGLCGLPILWTSQILTNLQVLKLKNLYSFGPTLAEISNMLNACPQLSILALSRLQSNEEESPPHDLPIVCLPKLAKLELTDLPLAYVPWLIQHIEARPCQTFAVDIDLENCDVTAIMH